MAEGPASEGKADQPIDDHGGGATPDGPDGPDDPGPFALEASQRGQDYFEFRGSQDPGEFALEPEEEF
jgi:hypothetical protein